MKSRVDATPLFLQDDLLKDSRIFATHYFINSNWHNILLEHLWHQKKVWI